MSESILASSFNLVNSNSPKTLRDLVEEKKIELKIKSDYELSKMLGIPNNTLVRLIDVENQKADFFSILKVARLLNINLDNMVDVYISSLNPEAIGELDIAEKSNYILRNFNLAALKKIKFIKDDRNIKEVHDRIVSYFNLNSIYLYTQDIVPTAFFSKIKKYSNDQMRMLWMMGAVSQLEKLNNPNEYDREQLFALVPKIRPYTQNEETGLVMVIRALYKIGVTVIVQKYITLTSIRGATFIVNGKPCIVITDYMQSYSTLWFTLLHELYHVLFDINELKLWKFHLSGDLELTQDLFKEDMADDFAHERLFPKIKLDYIKPMIRSASIVKQYAEKTKVHPGIIYSFYCYNEKIRNGKDNYPFYRPFFGKSEPAIKIIKLNLLEEDAITIYDKIEIVKQVYEYGT